MEIVQFDLKKYLLKNIFPSRTVLVFPPFNGFRRFLIHKLIEDNFTSSNLAAFSIGQDINRRIVVCYKGLIRDSQRSATALPLKPGVNMIEKENQRRQKSTPTAEVYRPPAARIADSRQNADSDRPSDLRRNRIRRPDQQMYVPRPKRASYGNEQPLCRSRSSSRTSLESDSCESRQRFLNKNEETKFPVANETLTSDNIGATEHIHDSAKLPSRLELFDNCDKPLPCNNEHAFSATLPETETYGSGNYSVNCEHKKSNQNMTVTANLNFTSDKILLLQAPPPDVSISDATIHTKDQPSCTSVSSEFKKLANEKFGDPPQTVVTAVNSITMKEISSDSEICNKKEGKSNSDDERIEDCCMQLKSQDSGSNNIEDKTDAVDQGSSLKIDAMETISISSDSRCEQSSNSSTITSSTDSKSSESSNDSETVQNNCSHKNYEQMEIDYSVNSEKKSFSDRSSSQEQNLKNRRIFPSVPVSDVLIISDSNSSEDGASKPTNYESKLDSSMEKSVKPSSKFDNKTEKTVKKSKAVDPSECDWESLYDDSGECLVPDLMEELTNSVGKVRVSSVESDYRPYQSVEERTNDGECIIEIYDFPAEFKTTDLFNVFAAYRNKNFQIKWVDDTHALGVFPSPLMADEVLACTLPFVKTRPLRFGIAESRNKARNLVLPPLPSMERPKTCTALARRLVSGALGLRLPTSSQEREKEKQVLKEAREKRRLEAKQREAAWDGTLTSENCI